MTKPKKKTAAKKKPVKKSSRTREQGNSRKRSTKRTKTPHVYIEPKTAAEHGITCMSDVPGGKCGAPVIWFDYELGEKNHMSGFVCDVHRVSNRVEKLAQPQIAVAAVLG